MNWLLDCWQTGKKTDYAVYDIHGRPGTDIFFVSKSGGAEQ